MVGEPAAIDWAHIMAHGDELYRTKLVSNRGWALESPEYPSCDHGPMTVKTVTADAEAAGGWSVQFKCRSATDRCAAIKTGVCPSWVPPVGALSPTTKSARAKADNGVRGACTCAATCQRGCPCSAVKVKCTGACHAAGKSGTARRSKCSNQSGVEAAVLPVVVSSP
jgi:hypothetical protein